MRWSEKHLADHLERTGVPGAANAADVSSPPFALPDVVIDLPPPVSVNRIWRANRAGKKRISISPEYDKWKRDADRLTMAMGVFRGIRRINGNFEALIIVRRRAGDLDNFSKGILDFLQSRGVIEDDKYCQRLILEWGEAPTGARVTVRMRP